MTPLPLRQWSQTSDQKRDLPSARDTSENSNPIFIAIPIPSPSRKPFETSRMKLSRADFEIAYPWIGGFDLVRKRKDGVSTPIPGVRRRSDLTPAHRREASELRRWCPLPGHWSLPGSPQAAPSARACRGCRNGLRPRDIQEQVRI